MASNALLHDCRDRVADTLNALSRSMLDAVEVELERYKSEADDKEQRDLYQKALDFSKSNRNVIADRIRENFLSEFDQRLKNEKLPVSFDFDSLSLVSDEEADEDVVFHRIEGYLRDAGGDALAAVEQRVSAALNLEEIRDEENPLAPRSIIEAVKSGYRNVIPDPALRKIILGAMNRDACAAASTVYDTANNFFVERNVLPDLSSARRPLKKPSSPARNSSPQGTDFGTGGPADSGGFGAAGPGGSPAGWAPQNGWTPPAAGWTPPTGWTPPGATQEFVAGYTPQATPASEGGSSVAIPGDFFSRLQQLAAQPPAGEVIPAGTSVRPMVTEIPQSFFTAMAQLQHGMAPTTVLSSQAANETENTLAGAGNLIHALRQSNEAKDGLPPISAITLDVVAMLFDYVLDNQNLPAEMGAIISRLQIPVLRVALNDRTFFSQRRHPARELLDRLEKIAINWSPSIDGMVILDRVEALVSRIQETYETDLDVFEIAVNELDSLSGEIEAEEAASVSQVASRLEEAEKDEELRATLLNRLNEQLHDVSLPDFIDDFLHRIWLNYLIQVSKTEGENSRTWTQAWQTLEDLIWSLRPMRTTAECRLLAGRLSLIIKRLRDGMEAVHAFPQEIEVFFDKLARQHHDQLKRAKEKDKESQTVLSHPIMQPLKADIKPASPVPPVTTKTVPTSQPPANNASDVAPASGTQASTAAPAAPASLPASVRRGVTIEFSQSGETLRMRLSWMSPKRTKLVFTGHGNKTLILTESDLLEELAAGNARILVTEDPLVERAMAKILDKMEPA